MIQRLNQAKGRLPGVFTIFAMLILVSCSGKPKPTLSIDTVSVYADPDANQNSAIAVDLVLVYDQELVKTIGQMSASKYFSLSKQLLLDNPTLLDVWHWELVPGQIVDNFEPDQNRGRAFGGFVFANYLTPGDHRVKVAPDGVIKILLLKDDLKNFAVFNSTDVKVGTTASNATDDPCNPKSYDDSTFAQPKKGTVTAPPQPCVKAVPKCAQPQPVVCCPPPRMPIPIQTRPLKPLPLLKPCIKRK